MKKIILICFCTIFIINSCNTTPKKKVKIKNNVSSTGFILNGVFTDYLSDKVYLNKIIEQTIYPIDSAIIDNNQFTFNGIVEYPERFALTFVNYSKSIVLILENTEFNIEIDPLSLEDPIISESSLNSVLVKYKIGSKRILKKIEYLYPQFQKARLENDIIKLEEIGKKMQLIENEFRDYTYKFILSNKNSFVSAMILRDQLKASNIDTIRIQEAYDLLSENVKECPDALIIYETLKLH